jgi:carboxypeptidase PM20D1
MAHECTASQAERLGKAVRLKTITMAGEDPAADPGYAEFLAMERLLRDEFPRAAAALRWEKLGSLALLLSWEAVEAGAPAGRAAGPGGAARPAPPFLFYAHSDVVPAADASSWTHPPFSGEVSDGCIWGRGTLDDKGILMALMEAVEALLAAGVRPSRTLYIAIGGDEELLGTRGASVIVKALADRGIRLGCVFDEGSVIAQGAVPFVSKPVALVGVAEKGFLNLEVSVTGKAGHSSMPGRGTAAGALSRVLAEIEKRPFPLRLTPTVAGFFKAIAPHASAPMGRLFRLLRPLWPFLKGTLSASAAFDAQVRTTQAATMLRAGVVPNVLPAEARGVVNIRILHGDTVEGVIERVRAKAARVMPKGFTLKIAPLPGGDANGPIPEARMPAGLWEELASAVQDAVPDAVTAPFLVVGATDSRRFTGITDGIVRFMPALLTEEHIGLLHNVDERISLENYGRMISYYTRIMRWAGNSVPGSRSG